MQKEATISVVIPFYNRFRFLQRLIESVLNQTIKVSEIYLVDNGSSDEQVSACYKFLKKYTETEGSLIWVSTIKKGNANIARNLGLELASTDYVAFLDSDDWWEPEHLEASLKSLELSSKSASYSGAVVHHPGRVVTVPSFNVNDFSHFGEFLYRKKGVICQTSSYVVRKDRIGQIRWDESLKRHQDTDFFINIHLNSNGWHFVRRQNVHFDVDEGGEKNIDYRSLVRFIKKWEGRLFPEDLGSYYRNQVVMTIRRDAPIMYKNFYKKKYISVSKRKRCFRGVVCRFRYFEVREFLIFFIRRSERLLKQGLYNYFQIK